MKKEVGIGGTYQVRMGWNRYCPVRLDAAHENGGWYGTNMETGRRVRIKSAARLSKEV